MSAFTDETPEDRFDFGQALRPADPRRCPGCGTEEVAQDCDALCAACKDKFCFDCWDQEGDLVPEDTSHRAYYAENGVTTEPLCHDCAERHAERAWDRAQTDYEGRGPADLREDMIAARRLK
jgi:hypothetical protein